MEAHTLLVKTMSLEVGKKWNESEKAEETDLGAEGEGRHLGVLVPRLPVPGCLGKYNVTSFHVNKITTTTLSPLLLAMKWLGRKVPWVPVTLIQYTILRLLFIIIAEISSETVKPTAEEGSQAHCPHHHVATLPLRPPLPTPSTFCMLRTSEATCHTQRRKI